MGRLISKEHLAEFVMPPFKVVRESEKDKRSLIESYLHLGDNLRTAGIDQIGVEMLFGEGRVFLGPKRLNRYGGDYGVDWSMENFPAVIRSAIRSLDHQSGPLLILALLTAVNAISVDCPNGLLHEVSPMKESVVRIFKNSYYHLNEDDNYFFNYQEPIFIMNHLPDCFEEVRQDYLENVRLAKEYFGSRWMIME